MRREFRWFEFGSLFINGALVVVGIYALYIYNGQLNVMRGQLGEIIKQYPEIKKSADAAKSAADTADATLKSSQQQFRTDQRPYVFASPEPGGTVMTPTGPQQKIEETLSDGSTKIYINVKVTNGGKSPAINMVCTKSEMYLGTQKEVARKFDGFVPEYPREPALILGSGVENVVRTGDLVKLSHEEFGKVRKRELVVYIIGAAKYTDVFAPPLSVPYETKYCFVYNPTGIPLGNCGGSIK